METRVSLDRLPDGYVCPEPLREKFDYDVQRKELVFHGFMSKSQYDKLRALSSDFAYQRAVERLFRDTSNAVQDAAQPKAGFVVAAAGALIALFIAGYVCWWG